MSAQVDWRNDTLRSHSDIAACVGGVRKGGLHVLDDMAGLSDDRCVPVNRQVVIVAFEGVQLLDVAGPADVFYGATRALGEKPGYTCVIATPGGRAVRTSAGIRIAADASLADIDPRAVDTMVVAGSLSMAEPLDDPRLVGALPRIAAGARRVCSVCGGAFLLAEAGLLRGRRATTHWAGCNRLGATYPSITVEPDRIFVRDGKIVTSAGVTAGIDLALALVEEDHGAQITRRVARWMVVFLQRAGGQSQFSERMDLPLAAGSPIRTLVDEIVAVPGGDHRLPVLADRAALSERQLSRIFVRETRTTPGRFVERVRVEAARDMLEASRFSVDTIAGECGFGSSETMRRAFLRVLSVGPGEYRQRFQRA